MSLYLDTTGKSTYGIALCGRCSRKFPMGELFSDPNSPALMVCREDLDVFDPYRLAARTAENIVLRFVRPDTNIATNPAGLMTQDDNSFIITDDGEGYIVP